MKKLRQIFAIVHIFTLVMLFGTLLNNFVAPKTFPWFNLLSLSFPFLMVINVIFLLIWLILKERKRFLFFLVPSLLLIMPIKRWVNFSLGKKEIANLKVMTFNVKSGSMGEEEIRNYIEEVKPDIVFFQESRFYKNEYLKIKDLDYNSRCFITELQSKIKIIRQGTILDDNLQGSSFFVDVNVNGKIIRLINVYLEPFSFKKSEFQNVNSLGDLVSKPQNILGQFSRTFAIHDQQVDVVTTAVNNSPYPVILAGDFNAVPNSYEYYHLKNGLQDAFVEAGNGSSTSFHDYKFPLRIDYIFCSNSIKPISYKVDRSVKLSDHFPVIAEFKIN